jgi:hypothetical protein
VTTRLKRGRRIGASIELYTYLELSGTEICPDVMAITAKRFLSSHIAVLCPRLPTERGPIRRGPWSGGANEEATPTDLGRRPADGGRDDGLVVLRGLRGRADGTGRHPGRPDPGSVRHRGRGRRRSRRVAHPQDHDLSQGRDAEGGPCGASRPPATPRSPGGLLDGGRLSLLHVGRARRRGRAVLRFARRELPAAVLAQPVLRAGRWRRHGRQPGPLRGASGQRHLLDDHAGRHDRRAGHDHAPGDGRAVRRVQEGDRRNLVLPGPPAC